MANDLKKKPAVLQKIALHSEAKQPAPVELCTADDAGRGVETSPSAVFSVSKAWAGASCHLKHSSSNKWEPKAGQPEGSSKSDNASGRITDEETRSGREAF